MMLANPRLRRFTLALSWHRAARSSSAARLRLFPEEINIIYDSKCNVCKLEMDLLARRDERLFGTNGRRIRLTDLESEYDESDPRNGGVSYKKGMSAINAVYPDGSVIEGVPVFVKAYDLVQLGWLFRVLEWPPLKPLVDAGYRLFAKHRTVVTRGSSLDDLIRAYEEKKSIESADCSICTDMHQKR